MLVLNGAHLLGVATAAAGFVGHAQIARIDEPDVFLLSFSHSV